MIVISSFFTSCGHFTSHIYYLRIKRIFNGSYAFLDTGCSCNENNQLILRFVHRCFIIGPNVWGGDLDLILDIIFHFSKYRAVVDLTLVTNYGNKKYRA